MADERLRDAITSQGDELKRRAEWIQKMIVAQTEVVARAQKTVDHYTAELQATNLAIDGLRAEWRKFKDNGTKEANTKE